MIKWAEIAKQEYRKAKQAGKSHEEAKDMAIKAVRSTRLAYESRLKIYSKQGGKNLSSRQCRRLRKKMRI